MTKRRKRVELYLLFEIMRPVDILNKWPEYSQTTVYKYFREWKIAKKKVMEMIKAMC